MLCRRSTILEGTRGLHRNWRAILHHGFEAGDLAADAVEAIEAHARKGRSLGSEGFVPVLEAAIGR